MSNYSVYPPTEICAVCGGYCCKHMGCHYSPTDFSDLSFEALKSQIEKGGISIDWWVSGGTREYYLRARHVGEPVVKGSWGGRCVNLTDTGCSLSWEERPLGGKALKPQSKVGEGCHGYYSKEQCKDDWKPYAQVLHELVEHFGEEETGTFAELMEAMEAMTRRILDGLD